jgi:hypothetical protein
MRAARVAAELTALGAPPALLAVAARVVEDEVRHVDVCGRVLDALAGGPREPLEVAVPRMPAATSERQVARLLVGDMALGKPVTAASFAAARARVREPLLVWAYTELLRDEARHATFGAKAASWVIRHWSSSQRQSLWAECLAASEGTSTRAVRDDEAEGLGLLPALAEGAGLPRWLLPHLAPIGMPKAPSNNPKLPTLLQ